MHLSSAATPACLHVLIARESFLTRGSADQQMNMLGHHYVTGHNEVILRPHLFQDFQKNIAAAHGTEKLPPSITAAGNEVPVTVETHPLLRANHKPRSAKD